MIIAYLSAFWLNGIADYFEIDPTIVRLAWLIAIFAAGGGLLAYLIALIVIPSDGTYISKQ